MVKVCASKRRFATSLEALAAAPAGTKPYACPECGGFHLTSRNDPPPSAKAKPEKEPLLDTPILLRAWTVKKQEPEEPARKVRAVAASKVKPDGRVLVKFENREATTEPIQPASLRLGVELGAKLLVEVKGKTVRFLQLGWPKK